MSDTVQVQARALGDPTRYAVFSHLAAAGEPLGVAELTEHFGLNHNAIRQHLARLVEAGLVEESTAPSSGRGRPRHTYRIAPAVGSRWGPLGPYERLAVLLAEALRTGQTPIEVGRRAVAESMSELPEGADPLAVVTEAMALNGFVPDVHRSGDDVEMVLHACPFEAAAVANPEIICAVHRGMAEGVVDLTDGEIAIDELVVDDPRAHACRLRLHVTSREEPEGADR